MICNSIGGGFIPVPIASLVVAWRSVGVGDFRVWLACWEARARRQDPDQLARHGFAELAKLAGISERSTRASVRRLVQAGLVEWSVEAIRFPDQTLEDDDLVGDTIGRGRGALAIPRRMLRFLANGARPALIAVALGLLLRCLSRRRDGFDGRGRVKASWIAKVFGVSVRAVKHARAELVELGWIEAEPSDQWSMNRWGRAFRIDLGWEAPKPERDIITVRQASASSSPPRTEIGASSSPPDLHQDPLPEREENQDPASGRPAKPGASLEGTMAKTLPAPKLADIRIEDLTDISRTLDLHRQAVAKGLVTNSERDVLRFVALAEHARQVGKANPPGLFAALLRRQAWNFITQGEEDAARRRLREHPRSGDAHVEPRVDHFAEARNMVRSTTAHGGQPTACVDSTPSRSTTTTPRKSTFRTADQNFEDRRAALLRQLAGRVSGSS
jgi:hypothetical protein